MTTKFYGHETTAVNQKPVASLAFTNIDALIGSIIQLDGRRSRDPEGGNLTFKWSFRQVPSSSGLSDTSFRNIRPDGSAVSFTPDKLGIYVVDLVVDDGELDSDPVSCVVNIQLSQVPIGEGLVPDAKFLWGYISNFWNLVEDREYITTIWSSVIQLIGAEYVKLWSNDYNKSLDTIQERTQRRWQIIDFTTYVLDDEQRVIVGSNSDGTNGSTGNLGETPGDANTSTFYIPRATYDLTSIEGNYGAKGRVLVINNEGYTINRVYIRDLDDVAYSVAVVDQEDIPDGLSGVRWRIPQLLHVPGRDLESEGVMAGDTIVFEARRGDTGQTAELRAQIVGVDRDRIGFEFTTDDLSVDLEVLVDGRLDTASGTNEITDTTKDFNDLGIVAGNVVYILEGDHRGSYVVESAAGNTLYLEGVEFGSTETSLFYEIYQRSVDTVSRTLFDQLVQDLKISTIVDTDVDIASKSEALISFMPSGINLATRPFSQYRVTLKAKKIIHNSKVVVDEYAYSIPALQEAVYQPPVVLRENLDFITEDGNLLFSEGLFTPADPAPENMYAEVVFYDNTPTIENNFGRLVGILAEDLTASETRTSYLASVKGLFYALTNGSSIANIRLGLQILLGLPYAEERGLILEIDEDYAIDSSGNSLSRLLVEDIDEHGKLTGFRRIYFYPTEVGLEVNENTGEVFAVRDVVSQWVPLSKGVEVTDYVKNPTWWKFALRGLEILKFFTFRAVVDTKVFNTNDVNFAFDFINKIKPTYTRVLMAALKELSDDIDLEEELSIGSSVKFYDDLRGEENTFKLDNRSQQGFLLWALGSRPFTTRTLRLLRDVETYHDSTPDKVVAKTTVGWSSGLLRGREAADSPYTGAPVREGDIIAIAPGQNGSSEYAWGMYEIEEVRDDYEVVLQSVAYPEDPETWDFTALDTSDFPYGTDLVCTIVRRMVNPLVKGDDLVVSVGSTEVTSATGKFKTNGVMIGDHVVIEGSGANAGEYMVDAVPAASTVTPNISETTLKLKNLDGTDPTFSNGTEDFRVIRNTLMTRRVREAKSVDIGGGESRVEVLDSVTGDDLDAFSPGLVGNIVSIADSEDSSNDGFFLVTSYLSPGQIEVNNPSTNDDASAQAVVTLNSRYHFWFDSEEELRPNEVFTASLVGVP